VGSLALLSTTLKDSVVNAINEVDANLEILRIAELDTGAADAYVVTTSGTFSRVDGNILNFIPANNNTGASTINEDTNGVADIKKYVEGAWIALEEGDLKKFQQVALVWNVAESAFQLAPKVGGGNIESIQHGILTLSLTTTDVSISSVDLTSSIPRIWIRDIGSNTDPSKAAAKIRFLNATTIRIEISSATASMQVSWEVAEYSGVKSLQNGTSTSTSEVITEVDVNKSLVVISHKTTQTSSFTAAFYSRIYFISSTVVALQSNLATFDWYVLEFN